MSAFDYSDEATGLTLWDRLGLVTLVLLVGAFLLAFVSPTLTAAGAHDDVSGTRGDGDLVASDEEDDEDDDEVELVELPDFSVFLSPDEDESPPPESEEGLPSELPPESSEAPPRRFLP